MIVLSPSADKNVYANLLKKDIPEPEGIVHANTDKTKVYFFRENQKIVTINQALTSENSVEIVDMIVAAIDRFILEL